MANSKSWKKIFDDYDILKHDFDKSPFTLSAEQIKKACQRFKKTSEKEVRILCKQDCREDRPDVFINNNLFLLPIKNGYYDIIKGEGYVDIPVIHQEVIVYSSKLDFELDTTKIGNSEMQHLDYAYATSLIRTFTDDSSLVLTIRGRKYTPSFDFFVEKVPWAGVRARLYEFKEFVLDFGGVFSRRYPFLGFIGAVIVLIVVFKLAGSGVKKIGKKTDKIVGVEE